jgi:glycosyltransferase involved in cell wall biosynthesis
MGVRLSVVIISRNEGDDLRRTVENMEATLPPRSEIIVVDDGSADHSAEFLVGRKPRIRLFRTPSIGVARARNFGAARTGGDILLFADAHLGLPKNWCEPLMETLSDPEVGAAAPGISGMNPRHAAGYGLRFTGPAMEVRWQARRPRNPVAAPILPGCALAIRREVFEQPGAGWDEGLLQRGNVDNEFSVRHWLLGYKLMIVPEVVVRHRFRRKSPFPVGWPQYLHNRLRLAFVHFSDARLGGTVAALRSYPGFGEALRLVSENDVAARRRQITLLRIKEDDWYFLNFRLNW